MQPTAVAPPIARDRDDDDDDGDDDDDDDRSLWKIDLIMSDGGGYVWWCDGD